MIYVVSFVDETPTLINIYSTGLPHSPGVDIDETAYESTPYSPLDQTGHDTTTHDGVAISSNSSTVRTPFGSYQMRPDPCGISEGSASVPNSLSPPQIREQTRGSVDLDDIVVHDNVEEDVSRLLSAGQILPRGSGESEDFYHPPPSNSFLPLTSQEAFLLQLYRNKMGTWMDSTDSERRMAVEVPVRALKNPILMYAILAYSSRHLARVADFDGSVSDGYYIKCLELLIPALNRDVGDDAELLAATCILRLFEQITVRHSPMTDQESHLMGSSAFISTQESCANRGGLLEAVFWLFIREDIYAALCNQRPLKADVWSCNVEINFDSGEINCCKWANWAVWLAAETVTFSFGPGGDDKAAALADWERLWSRTDEWRLKKPLAFAPIFVQDRDTSSGKYFPQIYHSQIWHVVGWQYYHLAKMLLLAHKPARDRVGLRFWRDLQSLQDEVVRHFRALVGLCLCSGQVAPRYQVCMGVLACGSWLTDANEQKELLHLLERCDSENAWPTATMINDLKEEWGHAKQSPFQGI